MKGQKHDPTAPLRIVLTETEGEILGLLLDGLKLREIAERRGISISTVGGALNMIYGKTGVQGRKHIASVIERGRLRIFICKRWGQDPSTYKPFIHPLVPAPFLTTATGTEARKQPALSQ